MQKPACEASLGMTLNIQKLAMFVARERDFPDAELDNERTKGRRKTTAHAVPQMLIGKFTECHNR